MAFVSRRTFVKLSALAGGAAMLAGLAACAPAASSQGASSTSEARASSAGAASGTSSAQAASAASASSVAAVSDGGMNIQVGGTTLHATLADTEAARALADQLASGPITVDLHSYGGFEKVGPLPQPLPADDVQTTTEPGDVMLYQGNQITIFYGSNTWAYTPLAKIDGATADSLKEAFGDGDVEVMLTAG